jgi:hypothetical protein
VLYFFACFACPNLAFNGIETGKKTASNALDTPSPEHGIPTAML